MPPITASTASMPSMARQARRRAGIPRKATSASTVPPPIPSQPKPWRSRLAVALVVLNVTVAVPLVLEELNVTVEPTEHVGEFVAPVGELVREQASVTVPEYPLVLLTVTVAVAELPAVTEPGVAF